MKDSCFIRKEKVPITKEEIRLISLGKLDLHSAKSLLDIGAGSGSVGIEACVMNDALNVLAIEKNEEACKTISANKDQFKLENYVLLQANAPLPLDEKFDRIFLGGSGGSLEDILEWSYGLLNEKRNIGWQFYCIRACN